MSHNDINAFNIIYVYNPKRAHKLLPLLEGFSVILLKSYLEFLPLIRSTKDGPGIIIVDTHGRFGILGLFASALTKYPLVIRLRGEIFRERRELAIFQSSIVGKVRLLFHNILTKICFHRAKMIIFNSQYLARSMTYVVKDKISTVVYNPYTVPKTNFHSKDPLLVSKKGFRLLSVLNMKFLSKVEPTIETITNWMPTSIWSQLDIQWFICGSGPYQEYLQKCLLKCGLTNRVHLVGWVDEVTTYYQWCDALIHLTRLETLGNVVMEAMIFEKPVITNYDSCGVRELVYDGLNGFVAKDAKSFLAALRTYAENILLRKSHGQQGKRLIESKFSISVQREMMRKALKQIFYVK